MPRKDMSGKPTLKWFAWVLIVVAIVLVAGTVILQAPDTNKKRGMAMAEIEKFLPEASKSIGTLVLKNYHEYRANTVRWSAAYFTCIFGAAFCSALAGVILKLDVLGGRLKVRNDLAAALAAAAALLITLSTIGNFQEKWQANRMAASRMENLAYDLLKKDPAVSHDVILERIQEINRFRNQGIVGQEGDEDIAADDENE